MFHLKLPRSSLSVSRDTVMFLLAFAKLSPEELVIFNEIIAYRVYSVYM